MKELLIQTAKQTGILDADKLAKFLEENTTGQRIDEVLLACPYFTEEQVLRLFAAAMGSEFFSEIPAKLVPPEFIQAVPATYAQHHSLVGIKNDADNGELTVVVSRPLDIAALDNVSKMTGLPVRVAVATRAVITAVIDVAYEQRTTVIEEVAEELDSQNLDQLVDEVASSDDLLDVVNRPPVIRLVNDMLFRALQLRASDIHVHPYEAKIQIRYRIDGILYDTLSLNRNVLPLIVSRIKVMAGMDIAERRMPQDGRCSVRLGQREVDLRISTVPTSFGERCVLRLLDKSTGILTLDQLGLVGRRPQKIRHAAEPHSRHHLRNRPHRQRQKHHALRLPQPHQLRGKKRDDHRRPHRVSARRHKPDAGRQQKGRYLRQRAAARPAAGPGCDNGRRGPRHRDRTNGDTVLADRPFGLQHPAHQRLSRRNQPIARPRGGAISGQLLVDCHNGAAAGPKGLPRLQKGI